MSEAITCSIDGCDKPVVSRELCNTHYKQVWRKGLADDRRHLGKGKPKTQGDCIHHPGVKAWAKNLCGTCYQADWRTRQPPCSVEGCANLSYRADGLCKMHSDRMRDHGSTEPRTRPTAEQRFWTKVDKNGPIPAYRPELGPCWLWGGSKNNERGSYGQFRGRDGYNVPAHHFSLNLVGIQVLPGQEVDHLCRVHNCVNPAHLEPVDKIVNMRRGWMALLGAPPHCPTCTCGVDHSI